MYLGRTSWWLEHMVEELLHLMIDRKKREQMGIGIGVQV
jgi:hypothetical protein